jgi:hypothetical protein
MEGDPLERGNRVLRPDGRPAREPAAILRDALDAFAERHPPRASAEIELDAATREHLRALGYIE